MSAHRNDVALGGTVASRPDRRRTPAGKPVLSFWLRVEAESDEPSASGCSIPIVAIGKPVSVDEGARVVVEGWLVERHRRALGESRYEVLARHISVV